MNKKLSMEPACVICGRQLKNPDSIERGKGEACVRKYASFTLKESEKSQKGAPYSTTPKYSYKIFIVEGKPVAVVIDESDGCACPSVTNAIETVAEELGVCDVIYRDTTGQWDYWNATSGFAPLGENGKPTRNMGRAIEIALFRYLAKAPSLF